jgi:hypothetical protein
MYRVMVFKGRRREAFKDAALLILSRILVVLAGSQWTIAPALQGRPPRLQALQTREHPTRQVTLWGNVPEGYEGNLRWEHVKLVETEFIPPFPQMPRRSFVMPCRSLCGLDLKRVHLTCLLTCRIRRGYYGRLPLVAELKSVWSIIPKWKSNPDLRHQFAQIQAVLFKIVAPFMEAAGS